MALMAQREALVAGEPGLASVFATLETHWPTLLNGIESDLIHARTIPWSW